MARWRRFLLASESGRETAFLVLRVVLGLLMMVHGWPKVLGGPERWAGLGGVMETFGITFAPMLWGAAAAFSELFGGALLILGLLTRPAAALIVFTMAIAALNHALGGDPFGRISHPSAIGVGCLAILLGGPGRLALDRRLARRR